ncbi:hypothetical protein VFPBJ_00710 [Purpureocillium lilacinum]|uniref:Uncharacterized protein n=1 Tax=Purpureocillium lilacinum TaxID=33203 RepID=A0A179HAP4_PURLI|nr:hypothetical protein VFPBJ_00710 [Purpureocillium lilacinum]
MSDTCSSKHPEELFTPGWHDVAQTPVVDGKYYDRGTGEIRTATDHQEYSGPPAVDIIIYSIHEGTTECCYRAARPFPLRTLLCHIVQVIQERKLEIDSLFAAPYAIRIILADDLTREEFSEVTNAMVNGIWDRK